MKKGDKVRVRDDVGEEIAGWRGFEGVVEGECPVGVPHDFVVRFSSWQSDYFDSTEVVLVEEAQ